MSAKEHQQPGECAIKFPLDILWLPKTVMRPPGPDFHQHSDCVLVVGISRPRIAALFLTLMLVSLFFTFHVLYDKAVYSIQIPAAVAIASASSASSSSSVNMAGPQIVELPPHHRSPLFLPHIVPSPPDPNSISISHPMVKTNSISSSSSSISNSINLNANGIKRSSTSNGPGPQAPNSARVAPNTNPNKMHFHKTGRRLPQALIVGVRKCGTRALLEMLFLHPQIQKAAGEVHFFDRDENYARGLDWYRKKMPYSFRGQITIEKSPSYFVTPEVPERVRAMNASIKLMMIVRDPVTRAISDYTQLRSHAATAAVPSPVASSAVNKNFEELVLHPNGTVNELYRPLVISMYHLHLHRWLEVFPREQILIVNGDQLIEDPLSQLQRIETFLGIPHRITNNNFYFNETKGFYCLRNDSSDKCLRETKGRKHPHVDPIVITRLRRYFADHNQKFYELIGEDLGWPEE